MKSRGIPGAIAGIVVIVLFGIAYILWGSPDHSGEPVSIPSKIVGIVAVCFFWLYYYFAHRARETAKSDFKSELNRDSLRS